MDGLNKTQSKTMKKILSSDNVLAFYYDGRTLSALERRGIISLERKHNTFFKLKYKEISLTDKGEKYYRGKIKNRKLIK